MNELNEYLSCFVPEVRQFGTFFAEEWLSKGYPMERALEEVMSIPPQRWKEVWITAHEQEIFELLHCDSWEQVEEMCRD